MNNEIEQMMQLWVTAGQLARNPREWGEATRPADSLIYKEGHPGQVRDLEAFAHLLGMEARVAGSHRSKSVELPVGMFHGIVEGEKVFFLTRDNFHDLKLVVVSSCPIDLPLKRVHRPITAEALATEKAKAFDYSKGHSNFDASKYETDAWYSEWCSRSILRDGDAIYICQTTSSCYYEGIARVAPAGVFTRYERGSQAFAVEVTGSTIDLLALMSDICGAIKAHVWEQREIKYRLEQYTELKDKSDLKPYQQEDLTKATKFLEERGLLPKLTHAALPLDGVPDISHAGWTHDEQRDPEVSRG
jgi:hypothetical protein